VDALPAHFSPEAENSNGQPDAQGVMCSAERRQNARYQSIYRVAKLRLNAQEHFCLVRNISSDGLMLDLYSPCAIGDTVSIDIKFNRTVVGKVVWAEGSGTGVQFDEPIDVYDVLARDHHAVKGWVPRSPRLNLACPARLRLGPTYHRVEICDISQGGVRICFESETQINDQIVLMLDGLPALEGVIRWQQNQNVGIAFNRPIALAALAEWVSQTHSTLLNG